MSNSEDFSEILEKLNYIFDKLGQLERRLVAVEKSLDKINHSPAIDSGTKVTESMEIPVIPQVEFSKQEIVEIYNQDFKNLISYVIKVSVTKDSLLQQNNNVIFLEKTKTANYWIIVTQNDDYYLLPKGNLKIDNYNYQTVASLFKCNSYQTDVYNKFTLYQPAIVEPTPNGQQWKLVKKGILEFITTEFDGAELGDIKTAEQLSSESSQEASISEQSLSSPGEPIPSPEEIILVADYNQQRELFCSRYSVVEVSEAEESINRRLFINIENQSQQIIFVKVRLGHYWIVNLNQNNFLFPKLNILINQETIEIVQALFECENYQNSNDSSSFTLIKPAKVAPLFQGENWVLLTSVERWILIERGVLKFTQ